jgi:hypothetical protein
LNDTISCLIFPNFSNLTLTISSHYFFNSPKFSCSVLHILSISLKVSSLPFFFILL